MHLSRSRLVVVAVIVLAAVAAALAFLLPNDGHDHGASPPPAAVDRSSTGTAPCRTGPLSATAVPACGRWWGATVDTAGTTLPKAVAAMEGRTGRRLDLVHTFHRWNDDFPTASERTVAAAGRMLFVNWQPTDPRGRAVAWAAIADGAQDGRIDAVARRLKTYGAPVFLSFSHEPEANVTGAPAATAGPKVDNGTPAQFAAAFRHVHDRIRAAGAGNVIFVWTVMGLSDPVWLGRYAAMWPGDDAVDWIAWDPYNSTCRGKSWTDFAGTVGPFYRWLTAHGHGNRPFMLAEYGSDSGQPAWYDSVGAQLDRFPNLRALVYFDLPSPPATCDWRPRGAPARAAFARLARTEAFQVTSRIRLAS